MRKIREALRLSFEGLSTREMALGLAIGRTTLREYLGRARDAGLSWPLPDALSDADLEHVVNGGVKTSQVAAQKSATVDMACLSAV